MQTPGRTYMKPPVTEAICEFRFASSQPWDWTIPGLVYEKIRGQFPNKQQESAIEVTVGQVHQQAVQPQVKAGVGKMRFLNSDESALVQIAPNLLAVNHLKYPGWSDFKPVIAEQLKVYREVAAPDSLTRIGLRYVNKVVVPSGSIELEEYFNAVPKIPEPVPQTFGRFVFQVDVPYELGGHPSMLRLIVRSPQSPESERLVFDLDLDMFVGGDAVPGIDDAFEWIELAHKEVKKAFRASLTDKTHKEVFEEIG